MASDLAWLVSKFILVLLVLRWEFGGSSSCVCLYTRCSISVLSHTLCRLGLCCVPGSVISSYLHFLSVVLYAFRPGRVFSQGLEGV